MLNTNEEIISRPGYQKIKRSAEHMKVYWNLKYAWVDTCCIDKRSSAELSEAINSMYAWYKKAEVCIAYLADIHHEDKGNISKSRWFTRGWTLQELVAPMDVFFVNSEWEYIGSKRDNVTTISKTTSIPEEVLRNGLHERICVADKMSWVSSRQTTRREDIAYCLMGLFDVNMPLLYGEGDNAFIRLQEEIIKRSDDHSIFAWYNPDSHESSYHGLLADSPSWFKHGGNLRPQEIMQAMPYSLSNMGIQINLPLLPFGKKAEQRLKLQHSISLEPRLYIGLLNVTHLAYPPPNAVVIIVKWIESKKPQFARVHFQQNVVYDTSDTRALEKIAREPVYFRQDIRLPLSYFSSRIYGFQVFLTAEATTGLDLQLQSIQGQWWLETHPVVIYRVKPESTRAIAVLSFDTGHISRDRISLMPVYVFLRTQRYPTENYCFGITNVKYSDIQIHRWANNEELGTRPSQSLIVSDEESLIVTVERGLVRGMHVVKVSILRQSVHAITPGFFNDADPIKGIQRVYPQFGG